MSRKNRVPKKKYLYIAIVFMCVVASIVYQHGLVEKNDLRYASGQYGSYDYLLLSQGDFNISAIALGLYCAAVIAIYSRKMSSKVKYVGGIFSLVTILCGLDMTIGSWGIPGRCGDDFTLGNCFLVDGLSEIVYYFVLPLTALVSLIVFAVGRAKLNKE